MFNAEQQEAKQAKLDSHRKKLYETLSDEDKEKVDFVDNIAAQLTKKNIPFIGFFSVPCVSADDGEVLDKNEFIQINNFLNMVGDIPKGIPTDKQKALMFDQSVKSRWALFSHIIHSIESPKDKKDISTREKWIAWLDLLSYDIDRHVRDSDSTGNF